MVWGTFNNLQTNNAFLSLTIQNYVNNLIKTSMHHVHTYQNTYNFGYQRPAYNFIGTNQQRVNYTQKTPNYSSNFADRLINTAKKYKGYNEKDGSYKLFTNGRTEAWCADFVSYVARECGIKNFNFPSVNGILDWGNRNSKITHTPKRGDAIICKGWDSKKKKYVSHTGIVDRVENGRVYTIEGNWKDKVTDNSYALNDSRITCYVALA